MPRVCVVTIYVSDMDQAVDFYCNKLGFEIHERFGDDLLQLAHDGIPLILTRVERSSQNDYPNVAQTVVSLDSSDLKATLSDLKSKGVDVIYDTPREFPGGIFSAIRDPFGNVFELLEFQG